ncbi:MAG: HEAT repeat domain-containing protein [Pirellulales bacterium]|nr:HEAT repeat domain-containing protein [Pirellulales bacterium]
MKALQYPRTTIVLTAIVLLGLCPSLGLAIKDPPPQSSAEKKDIEEEKAAEKAYIEAREKELASSKAYVANYEKKRVAELKKAVQEKAATREEKNSTNKKSGDEKDSKRTLTPEETARLLDAMEKGPPDKAIGVLKELQTAVLVAEKQPEPPSAPDADASPSKKPSGRRATAALIRALLESVEPESSTVPLVQMDSPPPEVTPPPSSPFGSVTLDLGSGLQPGSTGKPTPPGEVPTEWVDNLAKGHRQALTHQTPILIRVGAEWCAVCKRVAKEIEKPEVQQALGGWTRVYIDVTNGSSEDATRLGVQAVPTWQIQNAQGVKIAEKVGYLSAEDLVKWLAEHQAEASAAPADVLMRSGPPSADDTMTLVGQFTDRSPVIREAAVRRLLPHPKSSGPTVVDAFRKGDLSTRLAALELLDEWNAPLEGVDPWQPKTLTKERLAALADWAKNPPDTAPTRPEKLTEAQQVELGKQIARMLSVDDAEAAAIRERLAGWGPALMPEVYARLKDAASDQDRGRLMALRYRLVTSDALALRWPGGIVQLASADSRGRQQAAEQLSKMAGAADQALLLELFSDSDPLVREISLRGLQNIGGPQATAALVKLLADPEPNVRAAVLKQLEEKPQQTMVPAVAEYLKTEKDPDLLVHAIRFLRAASCEEAARAMLGLLDHESWQVRAEAAVGIAAHLDRSHSYSYVSFNGRTVRQEEKTKPFQKQIQDALIKLLGDPDAFVVSKAIEGLSRTSNEAAVEPLVAAAKKHPTLAVSIVGMLTGNDTLRDKALPHLMEFAQHETPEIRAAAVEGLSRTTPDKMEKVVLSALSDKDSAVRVAAAGTLVRLLEKQKKAIDEAAENANITVSPHGLNVLVQGDTVEWIEPEPPEEQSWLGSALEALGLKKSRPTARVEYEVNGRKVWVDVPQPAFVHDAPPLPPAPKPVQESKKKTWFGKAAEAMGMDPTKKKDKGDAKAVEGGVLKIEGDFDWKPGTWKEVKNKDGRLEMRVDLKFNTQPDAPLVPMEAPKWQPARPGAQPVQPPAPDTLVQSGMMPWPINVPTKQPATKGPVSKPVAAPPYVPVDPAPYSDSMLPVPSGVSEPYRATTKGAAATPVRPDRDWEKYDPFRSSTPTSKTKEGAEHKTSAPSTPRYRPTVMPAPGTMTPVPVAPNSTVPVLPPQPAPPDMLRPLGIVVTAPDGRGTFVPVEPVPGPGAVPVMPGRPVPTRLVPVPNAPGPGAPMLPGGTAPAVSPPPPAWDPYAPPTIPPTTPPTTPPVAVPATGVPPVTPPAIVYPAGPSGEAAVTGGMGGTVFVSPPSLPGMAPPSTAPATVAPALAKLSKKERLVKFLAGEGRPDWMTKTVEPLEKMLSAKEAEERVAAALALVALGKSEKALPLILDAAESDPAVPAQAVGVLQWLPWPERGDAFRRLWKHANTDGRQRLAMTLSELEDAQAGDLFWEILADEKMDLHTVMMAQYGLAQSYLGQAHYSPSDAPPEKRKAMVEEARPHLVSKSRWQRMVALSILLKGSRDEAAKAAEAMLHDPKEDKEAQDHAFRVLLAAQPKQDRIKTAVAALKGKSAERRKVALQYLAVGTESFVYSMDHLNVDFEEYDDFLGKNTYSSPGGPIVPEAPPGLKPEDVRPLLKDSDKRTAAMAGYLMAVMKEPAGLSPLLRYWHDHEEEMVLDTEVLDIMVYRAIARLDDESQLPVLKEIRARLEGMNLGRFYWTVRIMSGTEMLKYRKQLRQEAAAENVSL